MGYEKFNTEGDVYLAMRALANDRDDIQSYFYFKSNVWKEIRNHISNDINSPLFDPPRNHTIPIHRGTGADITLRDFGVFAKNYNTKPPSESEYFWIMFDVGFVHDENIDLDNPPIEYKSYTLNVPTNLIMDFNKPKFEEWISELSTKRNIKRTIDDIATLKDLINRYPEQAKELLGD